MTNTAPALVAETSDCHNPRASGPIKAHQGQGMGRDAGRNMACLPEPRMTKGVLWLTSGSSQHRWEGTNEHATGPLSVHILPGLS